MKNSTTASPTLKSPLSDGRLAGEVRSVAALLPEERNEMYELLSRYFDNVTREQFEADLAEKEWAILLTDLLTGRVQGFSTLRRLDITAGGQPVTGFFSGDTIVAREHWGETLLPRLWARHVFRLAAKLPDRRVFWFLISSGYKTYRFLPVFFRDFYPTHARPTPPTIQRILDGLASQKFPTEYDPERGIVRLAHATPLRPDVAAIDERRLRDPHVAFFLRANPGHARGEELACLTEILPANLTPAGRRMLGEGWEAGSLPG